jgi:hypothetical protein
VKNFQPCVSVRVGEIQLAGIRRRIVEASKAGMNVIDEMMNVKVGAAQSDGQVTTIRDLVESHWESVSADSQIEPRFRCHEFLASFTEAISPELLTMCILASAGVGEFSVSAQG